MADRKTPPSSRPGSKGGSAARGSSGSKSGPGAKSSGANIPLTKAGASSRPAASGTPGKTTKPPAKGKPKSIVNQKQTPWGMISAAIAVVLFAAAVVVVVVATRKGGDDNTNVSSPDNSSGCTTMIPASGATKLNDTSYLNELECASKISGVTFKPESARDHVTTTVKYDSTPPVGGNHNQYWADCTGKVYTTQLANENAVHMLEHGAIWITYNPDTATKADIAALKKLVVGTDRMALTPYAALKTPISLQAWGYQLFVQKSSDPRIATFIKDLRYNTKTTPEYGASCSDPYFDASQSYPGHPQNDPKS